MGSLDGQDLALERACHFDMFTSGQLGAHNLASLILDAALRSAMFRYPESRSVVRQQGAVVLDQ